MNHYYVAFARNKSGVPGFSSRVVDTERNLYAHDEFLKFVEELVKIEQTNLVILFFMKLEKE